MEYFLWGQPSCIRNVVFQEWFLLGGKNEYSLCLDSPFYWIKFKVRNYIFSTGIPFMKFQRFLFFFSQFRTQWISWPRNKSNPRPSRGSPLHYRCATPVPDSTRNCWKTLCVSASHAVGCGFVIILLKTNFK